ncbi:LysM peptidoglycan-binding domain-containing protein [Candidatus Poribacteria bacterium]|nr:LysM peptidoglycan-binding domain-containing protein [Candidatus Poribacteria bacterium]
MRIRQLIDLLKVGIIAYICLMLGWGPLVVSSYAKITMKPTDKPVKVITIEKGDTLWHLAGKYLSDPRRWPEFKKYNDYTNPDLIYPGEKMQVPIEVAKEMKSELEKELAKLRESYEKLSDQFAQASEELNMLRKSLNELKAQNRGIRAALRTNQRKIDQVRRSTSSLERRMTGSEKRMEQMRRSMSRTKEASVSQIVELADANKKLEEKISALEETMNSRMEEIAAKAEELARLREEMESTSRRVSAVEKAVSELDAKIKRAEWPYEKPSRNKRILAFLAAIVGATAWATLNSR